MPQHSLFWQHVLDLALPPLCLNCDATVSRNQSLCPACWKAINFISDPYCQRCGLPFEVPVETETLCTDCLTEPPDYTQARSVYVYDEASRPMILKFKHGDQLHPAIAMGEWMSKAAAPLLADTDLIVPVPLHPWRLFRRRYNQAAILAQQIGAQSRKPVLLDGLRRVRHTQSQGHHSRAERHKNIHNAFIVPRALQDKINGKKLLLVDDVLTTGATINECSRILQKAGASAIYVVTLARAKGLRR
jgi:ComF family protein